MLRLQRRALNWQRRFVGRLEPVRINIKQWMGFNE